MSEIPEQNFSFFYYTNKSGWGRDARREVNNRATDDEISFRDSRLAYILNRQQTGRHFIPRLKPLLLGDGVINKTRSSLGRGSSLSYVYRPDKQSRAQIALRIEHT